MKFERSHHNFEAGCRVSVYVEIDDSTQYATVYDVSSEKPLATLQRRRVYAKGFEWEAYDLNGEFIQGSNYANVLLRRIARNEAAKGRN